VTVVFFLLKLKPGVSRDDYETWVRTVDYPTARSLESIVDYRNHRIEAPLEDGGSVAYDYLERVVVTGMDAYRRDLATPAAREMGAQWAEFVGEHVAWTASELDG
jgi:hypothetical protein